MQRKNENIKKKKKDEKEIPWVSAKELVIVSKSFLGITFCQVQRKNNRTKSKKYEGKKMKKKARHMMGLSQRIGHCRLVFSCNNPVPASALRVHVVWIFSYIIWQPF